MKIRGRDLLDVARFWWEKSIVPLPTAHASKFPNRSWGHIKSLPDWSTVCDWFDTKFYRGICLLVGAPSQNLVVLDFDQPLYYYEWHARCPISTYTVETHRGFHVYVRLSSPPTSTLSMKGGDIKATGIIVTAPSTHPSGWTYQPVPTSTDTIHSTHSLSSLSITPIRSSLDLAISRPPGTYNSDPAVRDLISAIKQSHRIEDLLRHHTELIPSSSSGRWLVCRCPFHDDSNPSMWVDVQNQYCGCFKPSCVAHSPPLDVINVWALLHDYSVSAAIQHLAFYAFPQER